jgi:hypothetical protein
VRSMSWDRSWIGPTVFMSANDTMLISTLAAFRWLVMCLLEPGC